MTRRGAMRQAMLRTAAAVAAIAWCAAAAAAGAEAPRIVIPRVDRPPRLEEFVGMEPPASWDGRLAVVEGLVQRVPEDGQPASQFTRVHLGYDDERIYVVFVAFDDEPERIRAHLSRRENVFGDDIVEIQFDTFGDEQRAFSFLCNAYGVQWDAIWREGQDFDASWDTVWDSRGRLTDRGYVVLMSIPFRSLRFPPGDLQRWGVVLVRDVPRNNESSFWPPISSRIEGRLNQAGRLDGLTGISPGRNMQVIPYATATRYRALDRERATFADEPFDGTAGVDAKLVIRDRLALDATVNPDFSQVESDEPQVTVNERFEVFFPEKRPFFLENADEFATPITLLFTRRISDPRFGARLTGRAGPWSVGGMSIDDRRPGDRLAVEDPDDPRAGDVARFAVARVSRSFDGQSSLGLLATDRVFGGDRNSVVGVDGRIKLDDHWVTRFQAAYADTRRVDPGGGAASRLGDPAYSVELNRDGRQASAHVHYLDIGREFVTDAGFVPRVDIRNLHGSASYFVRPEGPRLIAWGPELFAQWITDHDGERLDWSVDPEFSWEFRRQTTVTLFGSAGRQRLRPVDLPSGSPSAAAIDFPVTRLGAEFETSFVRSLSGSIELWGGRGVNFGPPVGVDPFAVDTRNGEASLTVRAGRRHRIETTWLMRRLDDRDSGRRVLRNRILRARWDWQLTRRLSLRSILQHERTDADETLSRVDNDETLNADLLVTWLLDPWSAIYVGYNGNWADVRVVDGPGGPQTAPAIGGLLHDARQVFVKISWLFNP